jgi:hypothetical protein
MLAPTAPDEAITEIWCQVVGRGFKDGAGVLVRNWAMWFHSFWQRAGGSWLEERARKSANGGSEKKEIPTAVPAPKFKTPKWPWRLVALRVPQWVYGPEVEWQDLDLDSRRAIKEAWDGLSPEKQAEFLAEAREVKTS